MENKNNNTLKIYALPSFFIEKDNFDDYKYESTDINKIV